MTLTEFLLARITEDEAVATAAVERNGADWSTQTWDDGDGARINGTADKGNPRADPGSPELWDDEGALFMFSETAAHIARWDPARVLAECEAKRSIVARCAKILSDDYGDSDAPDLAERTLSDLASVYADHPDYRQEWS